MAILRIFGKILFEVVAHPVGAGNAVSGPCRVDAASRLFRTKSDVNVLVILALNTTRNFDFWLGNLEMIRSGPIVKSAPGDLAVGIGDDGLNGTSARLFHFAGFDVKVGFVAVSGFDVGIERNGAVVPDDGVWKIFLGEIRIADK